MKDDKLIAKIRESMDKTEDGEYVLYDEEIKQIIDLIRDSESPVDKSKNFYLIDMGDNWHSYLQRSRVIDATDEPLSNSERALIRLCEFLSPPTNKGE